MKLARVRIREFRSVLDSGEFSIGDITCLVGKNEAGKTAVLKALYALNPIVKGEGSFDVTDDYPRREVEDYKQAVEAGKRQPADVITATFILEDDEVDEIEEELGPGSVKSKEVSLTKKYDNQITFRLSMNDDNTIKFLIENASLTAILQKKLLGLIKPDAILAELQRVSAENETSEIKSLASKFETLAKRGVNGYAYDKYIDHRVPKFLYFDEYYQMRGYENIEALQQRQQQGALEASDHPLLGLVKLARLVLDNLISPERTQELTSKLEGAGNHLTKQIVQYWSQNKHIQMRFDVRPARPSDPAGMTTGTNIWANIYDSRHWVTTSVGTRSRGFVWFFSFLSWYSQVKQEKHPVILLLDEPGLSLHAKAQEDLLRYFEKEIMGNNQLIYSTHSPFMVDSQHFDRVRIVQDKGIDSDEILPPDQDGTKVFSDVFEASSDSLFPLQSALGYEIYQTLFVGPNSLVVEGVSDLVYLQTLSAHLEAQNREGLEKRWTITPVGGGDKVPTFVALLGNQKGLNVATLIDIQKRDEQNIENLYKKKLLDKNNVLTFADFTGQKEADIEDMFDEDFYFNLVNAEYKGQLTKNVSKTAIKSKHPRMLVRLDAFFAEHPLKGGIGFSHYRPARYLAENVGSLSPKFSTETLERFENAFKSLNSLL